MQAHPFLLLLFLSISVPEAVLSNDECSSVGLANVRKVIPDDASQARELLYKIWKITEKDFCRSTFHELPITSLGIARQVYWLKRNDMQLGTFLKKLVKDMKKIAEKSVWENWVVNRDLAFAYETANETALNINHSIESRFGTSDTFSYEYIPDMIISQLEELFPDLDFLETFSLNSEDVKEAIKGVACSWSSGSSSLDLHFGPEFERVVNTEGLENTDLDNARQLLRNFMTELLKTEVTPLLRKTTQKFRLFVNNMIPEMNNFHTFVMEVQTGKNPELENVLIRIPGKMDKIVEIMDEMFDGACEARNSLLNEIFSKLFNNFVKLVSQAINENNKIDFNKLIELLSNTDANTYIKTNLEGLASKADKMMTDLEDGSHALRLLQSLVQLTSPRPDGLVLRPSVFQHKYKARGQMLTAGAVQYFVQYAF